MLVNVSFRLPSNFHIRLSLPHSFHLLLSKCSYHYSFHSSKFPPYPTFLVYFSYFEKIKVDLNERCFL
jgi:hypothetical protein